MRIWSLHPKYLDTKGLVALWRETLLAKHVLEGKTNGYKNHPQLNRFKSMPYPVDGINQYLIGVYEEAVKRKFNFDRSKIGWEINPTTIEETDGQLDYEKRHLLAKLKIRDQELFNNLSHTQYLEVHPMFRVIPGEIADWEII